MKFRNIMIAGFSIGLFLTSAFCNDMELKLDDGRAVILHEDNSWGFTKFTVSDGTEEDMYITLSDNRTICLKNDNTWSFTKGQPPKKKSVRDFPAVFSSAEAIKATLDAAVQASTAEAYSRVAIRLTQYVSKARNSQQLIIACVKKEIGEGGVEVKYTPGWKAESKITLDKLQVKKVVTCVEEQIEIAKQEESNAKATAVGTEKTSK